MHEWKIINLTIMLLSLSCKCCHDCLLVKFWLLPFKWALLYFPWNIHVLTCKVCNDQWEVFISCLLIDLHYNYTKLLMATVQAGIAIYAIILLTRKNVRLSCRNLHLPYYRWDASPIGQDFWLHKEKYFCCI